MFGAVQENGCGCHREGEGKSVEFSEMSRQSLILPEDGTGEQGQRALQRSTDFWPSLQRYSMSVVMAVWRQLNGMKSKGGSILT